MAKLSARFVETAKAGKYGDSGTKGLQLVVSPRKAKKWVFRFQWQGKAREMGLGTFPEVGLCCAREKALAARRLVKSSVDPISERQKDRGVPTFGQLADEVVEQLTQGFRNEKHRAQWTHDPDELLRADPRHARRCDRHTRRSFGLEVSLDASARDCFSPSRPDRESPQRRQS